MGMVISRYFFLVLFAFASVLTLAAEAAQPVADWPMYGRNLKHTFHNKQSQIDPSNVGNLKALWTFQTGDAVSASPTVVKGVVYVGSWDGYFYALHANSGALVWKFPVDCQNTVLPVPARCLPSGSPQPSRNKTDGGIITSSAAVVDGVVYFAAGKTLYSLNAADGSLRWKKVICGNPDKPDCAADSQDPTRIFSSPAVFDGLVFVGHTPDGTVGYRGGIEGIDAATGNRRWRFEVDPESNAGGAVTGAYNRGCGSVWSSAAVDTLQHLVFFTTGNCNRGAQPLYHEAILALEANSGKLRWLFRPRTTDTCDFDFGTSPNVIDVAGGAYLGAGGKDGTYYLLNRATGALVWSKRVVFGGDAGGFFGAAAFDGQRLYSATGIGDFDPQHPLKRCSLDLRDLPIQEPSMHALNLADGHVAWERMLNYSFGATSLGDGVVFSGLAGIPPVLKPALKVYDAQSGALLKTFSMPGAVSSAATPVGKMLFVGSGNSTDGTGSGVHAFALH